MRLNQYLAKCGVASRRGSDELIAQGLVKINNRIAQLGDKLNSKQDNVYVDNKPIYPSKKVYYIFYKPVSVVTTLSDPFNRKTVKDFFKHLDYRVFPVGRLDYDSEGLLIMTNDGALSHKLQHPKYKISKIYHVQVNKLLTDEEQRQFEIGIPLKEGLAHCISIHYKKGYYEIVLQQGWNRQIRRMFSYFGIDVLRLLRVMIGNISLKGLKPKEIREISCTELKELKKFDF